MLVHGTFPAVTGFADIDDYALHYNTPTVDCAFPGTKIYLIRISVHQFDFKSSYFNLSYAVSWFT